MDFVWDSIWFVGSNVNSAYISHTDGIWEGFWALPKADRFLAFWGGWPQPRVSTLVVGRTAGGHLSVFCLVISLLRDVPSISIYPIWVMIRNRLRTRNIWKKEIETTQAVFVLPESAYQPRFVVILAGPPSGGHVGSGLVQRLVAKICRTTTEENLWTFDD